MQSFLRGFLSERQKRARGGRGLRFWFLWFRGLVLRLFAAADMVAATPAAASAVLQPELKGFGIGFSPVLITLGSSLVPVPPPPGPGSSVSSGLPDPGGWGECDDGPCGESAPAPPVVEPPLVE